MRALGVFTQARPTAERTTGGPGSSRRVTDAGVRARSSAQQATHQECSEILPSVADDVDVDLRIDDSVDEPIRLPGRLTVVPDPEVKHFCRDTSFLREDRQFQPGRLDFVDDVICRALRIMLRDEGVEFFEVGLGVEGDLNRVGARRAHAAARLALTRAATPANGRVAPASPWRLPSAKILSRARLSCVLS